MTDTPELSAGPSQDLAGRLTADVDALDRELAEIDMLVGQARAEATRHEQKRAAAAERLESAASDASPESYGQLVTLTRRAVLMESQVDLLDGKRKALARHRDAVAAVVAGSGRPMPRPRQRRRRGRTRRAGRHPGRAPALGLARGAQRPGGSPP